MDFYPVRLGAITLLRNAADGTALMELRGDRFVRDEHLVNGVASCDGTSNWALFGSWPDRAWLLVDYHPWTACEPNTTPIYRWRRDRWVYQSEPNAHMLAFAPYVSPSSLLLEVPRRTGPPWGYTLKLFDAPAGVRTPVPQRVSGKPPPDAHNCYTVLDGPVGLLTSPRGSVHVIGASRCRYDDPTSQADAGSSNVEPSDHAVSEYWANGAASSRILDLPIEGDSEYTQVEGLDAEHVWVSGLNDQERPAIAHFDGHAWALMEVPAEPKEHIVALAAEPDGALWVAIHGDRRNSVYRAGGDSQWTSITLPSDAGELAALEVRAPGDVWLRTDSGVYRTIEMPSEVEWQPHECTDDEREKLIKHAARGCGSGDSHVRPQPPNSKVSIPPPSHDLPDALDSWGR